MDKMVRMLENLLLATPAYLALDAYYANRKMVLGLAKQRHHLICRVRTSAVVCRPVASPAIKKRGPSKLYGDKIRLHGLFQTAPFTGAASPAYGEIDVQIM